MSTKFVVCGKFAALASPHFPAQLGEPNLGVNNPCQFEVLMPNVWVLPNWCHTAFMKKRERGREKGFVTAGLFSMAFVPAENLPPLMSDMSACFPQIKLFNILNWVYVKLAQPANSVDHAM